MIRNLKSSLGVERGMELLLFFFICSFAGWVWEAVAYWFSTYPHPHILTLLTTYRGVLHGVWVPIYGVGALIVVLLKRRLGSVKTVVFFLWSALICGGIEYMTSWILEKLYHARWWDYSGQLFNLNGRVSLLSILFFGMAGVAVAYFFEPLFEKFVKKMKHSHQIGLCVFLGIAFCVDCVMSLLLPNLGLGVELLVGR